MADLSSLYQPPPSVVPPSRNPDGSINWRGLYDAAAADLSGARDAFIRAFQTAAGMRDNYTLGEGDTDAGARGEVRGPSAMALAGAGMTGAAPGGMLAAPRGGVALGAGPIRAYHASPHNFDRFDMSKIGTGEGAQIYGRGLYFAESPAVSGRGGRYDTQFTARSAGKADLNQAEGIVLRDMQAGASDLDVLRNIADRGLAGNFDEAQALLNKVKAHRANIYEVAIHADPKRLLDWDAPLKQQPEVREALRRAGFISPRGKYEAFVASTPAHGGDILHALQGGASEGSRRLAGTPEKAAAFLNDAGIPGIRYFDAESRAAGGGSRNYVVFDDKLIEILRKYGLLPAAVGAGAVAAGGAQAQPTTNSSLADMFAPKIAPK